MCNQELKVEKAYIISSGLSRTETFEENSFKVTSLIDWLIGEHTTKVPAFPLCLHHPFSGVSSSPARYAFSEH
jgi:hypothetical protein